MIKNISNLQMSTFLSSLGLATSKTTPPASTGNTADKTKFDSYIRTAQDSLVDTTYSANQTDDGIAPEDRKYMQIVSLSDGSYLTYPPEDAPLEAKKAWIEAMKQLSPEDQFVAKSIVSMHAALAARQGDPSAELTHSNLKNSLSGLTSYKQIFQESIKSMEEWAKTASLSERETIANDLKINNLILDTFTKHNIA